MIKKKTTTLFIFSLLFTIFLPAGIVLTILYAKMSGGLQIVLFVLGIIMIILGFYGSPMLWINFANMKYFKSLVEQIKIDNVQDINQLAQNNDKKLEVMLKDIQTLLSKRYLTGYEIMENKFIVPKSNKTLSKNDVWEQTGDVYVGYCKSCGARVEMIGNNKTFCPYCGRRITKD